MTSERFSSGFGDGLILFPHTPAHSDSPNHLVTAFKRDTARENHHAAPIGSVYTEELIARLA